MINAVIIEDEPRSKNLLQRMISNYSEGICVLGTAEKVYDAISLIKTKKPQLVFLDIELTDGQAFEILNHFSPKDFITIFITGYDNYGIQAMKREALDYILKPLSLKELLIAIEKAKKKIKEQHILSKVYDTQDIEQLADEVIVLKEGKQRKVVRLEHIFYVEAYGKYTKWHTQQGTIVTRNALSRYAELLPKQFLQIHRSYLINMQHIIRWNEGSKCTVTLKNNVELLVSHRQKGNFLHQMRSHQK